MDNTNVKKIQTWVTAQTFKKLKQMAALRGVSMGRIIDELLEKAG